MSSRYGFTTAKIIGCNDNNWTDMCFGDDICVAVASSGKGDRVMTSLNAYDWNIQKSAADNDWTSVTYGNGLFVAVASSGNGDRVMTSPDGKNWTLRKSAADNNWINVEFGNGVFVALASDDNDNIMTSKDGITWTLRKSFNGSWKKIYFGDILFTFSSSNISVPCSGVKDCVSGTLNSNNWLAVIYEEKIFVITENTKNGVRAMTSNDGYTWNYDDVFIEPENCQKSWSVSNRAESLLAMYKLCYDGNEFINNSFIGCDFTNYAMMIGENSFYNYNNTLPLEHFVNICYTTPENGGYYAINHDDLLNSVDGFNWNHLPNMQDCNGWAERIYYADNTLLICKNNYVIKKNFADDNDFQKIVIDGLNVDEDFLRYLCFGNGTFVVVSYTSNKLIYSKNAIDWNIVIIDGIDIIEEICYGDKFVVVGNGFAAYSYDAITWTIVRDLPSNLKTVDYINNSYIAACPENTDTNSLSGIVIIESLDGIRWTQHGI